MNFQPKLKEVEMKNTVKNICAAMVISLCAAGHLSATENNPNNDNKFMYGREFESDSRVGQDIPTE